MTSFGRRVRAARRERGLSQEGLARLVDTSKNSVQNWERTGTLPRCETVAAIARVLDVSSDYLLGLSDELAPIAAPISH
jgi:transcriptional regulator with XRE-family HTH domain